MSTAKREPILVYALDVSGYELNSPFHEGEETMKAAKETAKRLLADKELIENGLYKVEIRQGKTVIQDAFVPGVQPRGF